MTSVEERPPIDVSRGEIATAHRTPVIRTLLCGFVAATVQSVVVVPFLGRYGWDRDELYFFSAAKHPALGYVDFPPVTAWIGWIVRAAAGDSLVALRATSLAAMLLTVVLVAFMARELGAGVWAQSSAALLWALSPYALGAGSIFHPTWFDTLCWVSLLYVLLVTLNRDTPRLWILAGVIAGIGLETKYTIAFLLFGVLCAFLVTDRRRLLRSRWPWVGVGIAVVLASPNLYWQARHGWPSIHFASSQNAKTAEDTPPGTFILEQLFLGAGLLVAALGVLWLWRSRKLRPLAILPPLVTVFFLVERGRAYYPLPADSIAIAAGVTMLANWIRTGPRRRSLVIVPLLIVHLALVAYALPVLLPVRSTASMISSGVWRDSFYKDEIGWPELSDEVFRAWLRLPSADRRRGAIVAGNYGEASALDYYAPGSHPMILSGHLSWQYWRPEALPQRFVLFVGYSRSELASLCERWRVVATVENRWHLDNEERGRLIAACRLARPLGDIWLTSIASTRL